MACSEPGCTERSTYHAADMEASKGLKYYKTKRWCDYHGPLPLTPKNQVVLKQSEALCTISVASWTSLT